MYTKAELLFCLLLVAICAGGCSSGKKDIYAFQNLKEGDGIEEIDVPAKSAEEIAAELEALNKRGDGLYKVGAGDKFNIYVYDEPGLETKGALVKSDGMISAKLVGEVRIAGLSLKEANEAIGNKYRKFIKVPRVTLLPTELSNSRFTIIGKVNNPGVFPVGNNTRIIDALAIAGGFTTGIFKNNTVEMADLEHAFVARKGRVLPVDFIKLVRKGDRKNNILLRDGDYIYIPSTMNREVFIIGEVIAPGFFGYSENLTLLQLISKARGFKDSASLQGIIIRGSLINPRVYSVDIRKIMSGRRRDVKLQPEDIVFISKSFLGKWNQVLNLVLPSIETIQTGLVLDRLSKD